jgi:hypothetical protein
MFAVSAMPMMHKEMQQRTSQQQQEGQRPEQVSAMFGQQEKRRDGEKSQHGKIDLDGARVSMWNEVMASLLRMRCLQFRALQGCRIGDHRKEAQGPGGGDDDRVGQAHGTPFFPAGSQPRPVEPQGIGHH